MLCYKDMTFCSFWKGCIEKDCPRALTPWVEESAKDLGLLISQFMDKPECFKNVNKLPPGPGGIHLMIQDKG